MKIVQIKRAVFQIIGVKFLHLNTNFSRMPKNRRAKMLQSIAIEIGYGTVEFGLPRSQKNDRVEYQTLLKCGKSLRGQKKNL